MRNKLLFSLILITMFVGVASAAVISRPTKTTSGTSYSDGTVPHASDFNGDMDTIYTDYNGNITNANISPTAAIAASKILTNFTTNLQVTSASSPCFINIDSSQGVDLRQWRLCQSGGTLTIGTYTDAGALIITPLSIARASGLMTSLNGMTITAGNLLVSNGTITNSLYSAKSFLYVDAGKNISSTAAATNGQILIGSTGNIPSLATLSGTATHICNTNGAGTITVDFCANPTLTSPVLAGTPTGSWTSMALTNPAISGTVTGGASYTAPTITSPSITGTVSGGATYSTPTLTTPVINGAVTGTGTGYIGSITAGSTLTLNPYALNTTTTQAHGLGAHPFMVVTYLECLTAELGYSIGDRVRMESEYWSDGTGVSGGATGGFGIATDTTNVVLTTHASTASPNPNVMNKTTRALAAITLANWKLIAIPYKLN